MPKSNFLAKLNRVLNEEILSVWLFTLAIAINIAAWVIPRGSYRSPSRDPLAIAQFVAAHVSDGTILHYFWHAVITLTAAVIAYGSYRVLTLSMSQLADRVDL